MPANLPPQYYAAEKKLRSAKDPQDRIAAIEEMLAIMPKHKGTDHLRAELRKKIAKLNEESGKKATIQRTSVVIPKEGAGQVVVIGMPNSGKSQLLNLVTNATPLVADYPFTTRTATPGMMEFENVKIQLIDTPPVSPGSTVPWLTTLLIHADGLLIMIDLSADPLDQMEIILAELDGMKIKPGEMPENETDSSFRYKKAIIAGNKIDVEGTADNFAFLKEMYGDKFPVIAISGSKGKGIEELKAGLYRMLGVIRVYTKMPGEKPDFTDPIILKEGSTLGDAATAVHKDLLEKMKYARLWGSGKHDGIMVNRNYILQEGDIVELHT